MKAPEAIISEGQYNFGQYNTPFKKVNLLDAKKHTLLPFSKSFLLREWQAFQILTERHFGMIAIYNTKKVSLVQFILYDIQSKKKIKFEKKVLPWQLKIPNGLYQTTGGFSSSDCSFIVNHDIDNNSLLIDIDIAKTKKTPRIKTKLKGIHDVKKYTPIVVCMPFAENRGMYSHKCLMPLEGEIILGDEKIDCNPNTCSLIIDDHKGYYPYVTKYDWITGAGFTKNGKRIGFNFTDNQIQNKEKYNENGIWLDGKLHYLPPIKVSRPNGYRNDWIVTDKEGTVNLTFSPVEHTAVNLNLLILKSKYQGPYGYFNGYIQPKGEDKIMIENLFGMGEDFYLRS